jgi:dienelactone hydrolase
MTFLRASIGCVIVTLAAGAACASEQVAIQQGDMALRAVLYRPAGPGPFPAIVGLHGCGGLRDRSGPISSHLQEWGQHLSSFGFAVVFPDSFGSRGLDPQCRMRERQVRASRERVDDADAARQWLQSQSWVDPGRVSLLGWSNGATATLWTVRTGKQLSGRDFRSAVALYPGCRDLQANAWGARIPTLTLVGADDDWTPPGPCQQMVAGARGRSALAAMVLYPAAYHGFDRANSPVRLRTGLAYTADGSGKAHIGTNELARADAFRRVPAWLAR